VNVVVNGERHEIADGETVAALLARLGVEGRFALIERNGAAVERAAYDRTELESGDELVVARPVAGG
jgi:thiamine biosynthesis protein ThiS